MFGGGESIAAGEGTIKAGENQIGGTGDGDEEKEEEEKLRRC